MKRQRGRSRRPVSSNRSYESNGPDVKIRGTASQIHDKYMQYARDAQTAGDRIKAENYLQHAEHYYRLMVANGSARNSTPSGETGTQDNNSGETSPDLARPEDPGFRRRQRRFTEMQGVTSHGNATRRGSSDGDSVRSNSGTDDATRKGETQRSGRSALDALAEEQAIISKN